MKCDGYGLKNEKVCVRDKSKTCTTFNCPIATNDFERTKQECHKRVKGGE